MRLCKNIFIPDAEVALRSFPAIVFAFWQGRKDFVLGLKKLSKEKENFSSHSPLTQFRLRNRNGKYIYFYYGVTVVGWILHCERISVFWGWKLFGMLIYGSSVSIKINILFSELIRDTLSLYTFFSGYPLSRCSN